MEGNDASRNVNFNLVAEIVSIYIRHNRIAADELPRLISEVYRTLESLGRGPPPPEEPPRSIARWIVQLFLDVIARM